MSFGWWKREDSDSGELEYLAFSTGTVPVPAGSAFNDLGGTATYAGPAAGQYAIYEPASQNYRAGSFAADARLSANFTTDMLDGTITNFDVDSDWTLILNAASIAGARTGTQGAPHGAVEWKIGNQTGEGGEWNAQFYSDQDSYAVRQTTANVTDGTQPSYQGEIPAGVSGTFNATFGEVGALIGAFGAHLQP